MDELLCIFFVIVIYQWKTDPEVVREFIVNSLLRSYEQTKAIDLEIHRGVMDYIRSQIASKSLRK